MSGVYPVGVRCVCRAPSNHQGAALVVFLYDQFAVVHESPILQGLDPDTLSGYAYIKREIARAPRYVLDRSAVMMIQNTTLTKPSGFLAAMPICRLPAPTIWVEISFADRTLWLTEANRRGLIESRDIDNSSPPSRLGFLLSEREVEGERVIDVKIAWTHGHNYPHIDLGMKALMIFMSKDSKMLDAEFVEHVRKHLSSNSDFPAETRRQMKSPKEFEAGVQLEARMRPYVPEYFRTIWDAFREDSAMFKKMNDSADYDMLSEWRFVLSLLTVLNSRNLIKVAPETDVIKLNKKREQTGKPRLLTHRPITLNLSPVQKRRVVRYIYETGLPRQRNLPTEPQYVLGHWKVRKGGVFWWSDHDRHYGHHSGSADEPPPRTIRVTA